MSRRLTVAVAALGLIMASLTCAATIGTATPARGYSATDLYNQGNAAARSGQHALAVLNYERARLLAPRDPDIQANLQTVRQRAGLPAQQSDWFTRHARFASPDTVYGLGLVGLLLVGGALVSRQMFPARRMPAMLLAAVGLIMTGLSLADAVATRALLRESVVLTATAARASPVSGSDAVFTLPAAALVEVQETHQDFVLVRDSSGREGWMSRSDQTPIVPPDSGS